ncbi:MAG TPA: DNA starvation/stationary phase protection protein [Bryobacteraceae bacterium]|jgi:starvation-inducible DNA-binding protein|nr:DNA starvation/stationary phase protection protein [Bryobacteraceae bacterium]
MKQKNHDRVSPNGHGSEFQQYGTVVDRAISLDNKVRATSCEKLNQILSDTITLRDMYKKHHWQVTGPTFYQLHLLFDKHFGEQVELVDLLAERVQTLGGVAIAMAHDVAETTRIERPPRGREDPNTQLYRLLQAHELIIAETREAIDWTSEADDQGTNDVLISNVLRTNEFQVWFITEQLTAAGVEGKPSEEAADLVASGHRRH